MPSSGIYHTVIRGSGAVQNSYRWLLLAQSEATRGGRPYDARRIQEAIFELEREQIKLADLTAIEATRLIRARIEATRKRPRRSGRLEDAIKSEPIPDVLPRGSIGIARFDRLDAGTINPDFPRAGPYWRAQEYGYDHRGRIVPGYFQPGDAPPDAGSFRVHPYFQQQRYQRGMPAMNVQRPIEARHFLRDGANDALGAWRRAQSDVETRIVTLLRRIS